MRRIIIMTFILGLAASVAWAQDTTKVTAPCACFLSGGRCGCRVRPVNDYSGLNSLRSRLANPSWDGRLPGIGTGLRLEEGRIRPLSRTTVRTVTDTPDTSSETFADKSHSPQDPYLEEVERGETPFGAPVFVFFRLAGTFVTDAPQLVGINAAADLAVERNLKVRITGSADSATGSSVKNDAIAVWDRRAVERVTGDNSARACAKRRGADCAGGGSNASIFGVRRDEQFNFLESTRFVRLRVERKFKDAGLAERAQQ